ncbi:MAG TPA: response regulator, partial [Anaerolineaceae bacterium]|nr:response regulator [Anaerolineaceae bacterium]
MGKPRLLIVEDDHDIANMLRIYFTGQGYAVDIAPCGLDALEQTRQGMPHLIVLDIMLPDIDGYEVCRQMRTAPRTSHIPVLFLTQKDERSDKLKGLELGADDYITKPFDIEELKLRVHNALARAERESLTDPNTGLPSGRLIEDQLRRLMRSQGWAFLEIRLNHFEAFKDVYGFIAASDVLRFTALLLGEVADAHGTPADFLGHAGGDHFVLISDHERVSAIGAALKSRFAEEIKTHYSFLDRQQGFILAPDSAGAMVETPLM